ncbi:phosphatase [Testudinibacter sp. TR-2022]|uniref:phosphatase n=1 Tax=Testudinibacter sp. TR-2022 TaxID=2585029 RepID=UPI001118825D|nr:phosphatase [Testudinibacter sp. TR-2022]TNH03030.1 phosphatase [Pasteurellaceae bacterium Phil31]TNH09741.1 phosphatase [Testudinibacter sp. TR-2022]TNH11128.1 phosphatase [Testudinibacter sp. TR-2022]TNH15006.1 phosphatase [Testudinibacter sp. TR-2022]TNH16923.1 phosphatase [Testudinibacter sp. TR-2022]
MSYPVDLHTHTIASSHAYSTLHEYIAVAKQRGIRLLANTDHGPALSDAPHEWHFSNLAILPRFIDGVGILRGIEANILNVDGETDCNDRMRRSLDLVLAGFHPPSIQPTSREVHTEALINCIKSGKVDIITHPGNPKFPIDAVAVAQAAAKYNVALEINNASFLHSRLGSYNNCLTIATAVRDAGGWVSIGSDSHYAGYLGNFEKSLALLEAADFPNERVLNQSPRVLLDFLESRGWAKIVEFADL